MASPGDRLHELHSVWPKSWYIVQSIFGVPIVRIVWCSYKPPLHHAVLIIRQCSAATDQQTHSFSECIDWSISALAYEYFLHAPLASCKVHSNSAETALIACVSYLTIRPACSHTNV